MSEVQDRGAALRAEVTFGRAGHLFHRWDHAFEQLCDAATLDEIDVARWSNVLEYRTAWCDLHGAKYYFFVDSGKARRL